MGGVGLLVHEEVPERYKYAVEILESDVEDACAVGEVKSEE